MFAKLFFSLYFIILVVIYMFQDRIPKKIVSLIAFKIPFKMIKYYVIILVSVLTFNFIIDTVQTAAFPWIKYENKEYMRDWHRKSMNWEN